MPTTTCGGGISFLIVDQVMHVVVVGGSTAYFGRIYVHMARYAHCTHYVPTDVDASHGALKE